MRFDPERHHRRSIRLKGYDYRKSGAYFVTICTQNRECLFGEIVDGQMILNDVGRMVQSLWDELPRHFPNVELDAFGAMPNHVHGIIMIRECTYDRAKIAFVPTQRDPQHTPSFENSAIMT